MTSRSSSAQNLRKEQGKQRSGNIDCMIMTTIPRAGAKREEWTHSRRSPDPLAGGFNGRGRDGCIHFTTDGGSSRVRLPGMLRGTFQPRLHTEWPLDVAIVRNMGVVIESISTKNRGKMPVKCWFFRPFSSPRFPMTLESFLVFSSEVAVNSSS